MLKKEYIAIVQGHLPALHGSIKTQIVRDPKNRKKFIKKKFFFLKKK